MAGTKGWLCPSKKLHLLYCTFLFVKDSAFHVTQHHLHETWGLCSEQCLLLAFSHPHSGWNQWRLHQPHRAPTGSGTIIFQQRRCAFSLWHFFSLCQIPFSSNPVMTRRGFIIIILFILSVTIFSLKRSGQPAALWLQEIYFSFIKLHKQAMCSPSPAIFEIVWDYLFLQPPETSRLQ